ncbi:MAG: hypothetical protein FE78DRAFT_534446 [Acidomyces sp. 'richmondensis']|nr:MAG: hypothetical protein FE78DRAFT_534446 [Acidomyces sp. 'richmondensis']
MCTDTHVHSDKHADSRLAGRQANRQTDRQTDRQTEGNHAPFSLLQHASLLGASDNITILLAVTLLPLVSTLTRTDTQAVQLHNTSKMWSAL